MELLRGSMQKLNPYADEYMDDKQMYEMYSNFILFSSLSGFDY